MKLVTFLGIDDYRPVAYVWRGNGSERSATRTCYVACALTEIFDSISEVAVVSTDAAWEKHGEPLRQEIDARAGRRVGVSFRQIPDGRSPQNLWDQFRTLCDTLRGAQDRPILDITHGFRSQPFFAASVLMFLRAVEPDSFSVRVVYGEAERPEIWELTPFIEVVDWALALRIFLRSGQAREVADATKATQAAAWQAWDSGGRRGPMPRLGPLAEKLKEFANDLITIRTGGLLLGKEQGGGSAMKLLEAIVGSRDVVERHLPPLVRGLEILQHEIEQLVLPRDREGKVPPLGSEAGHSRIAALARLYLRLGRVSEVVTTVREGLVSRGADPSATIPGVQEGYDHEERCRAERALGQDRQASSFVEVRNDILHGGFRKQPLSSSVLLDRVERLVEDFETAPAPRAPDPARAALFVNVSNHPSAAWRGPQRDAATTEGALLVDVPFPQVSPAATAEDLEEAADAVESEIERLEQVHERYTRDAMVMGEPTLAFLLVARLQKRRIRCVAATSWRESKELGTGERLTRFGFEGFREYPRVL
jgi:CRISPR-associated protein Csx16